MSSELLDFKSLVSGAGSLQAPSNVASRIRWQLGRACPITPKASLAVREALEAVVAAQDDSVDVIVERVRQWEQDAAANIHYPLIMAFSGTTGVGKTSSALAVARALSPPAFSLGDDQDFSEALVIVDGSAFSGRQTAADAQLLRDRMYHLVAQKLYECNGNAIIVVDEAQKISADVLDALSPLMRDTLPMLQYFDATTGKHVSLPAKRLVVIFTSDIGRDEATRIVARAAAEAKLRSAHLSQIGIPRILQRTLREELEKRGADVGLNLGDHTRVVVPFLPLTQLSAQKIIQRLLHSVANTPTDQWDSIVMPEEKISVLLSDAKFVMYLNNTFYDAEFEQAKKDAARSSANISPTGDTRVENSSDGSSSNSVVVDVRCARPVVKHWIVKGGARLLQPSHYQSALSRFIDAIRSVTTLYDHKYAVKKGSSRAVITEEKDVSYIKYMLFDDGQQNTTTIHVDATCPQQDYKQWKTPALRVKRCVSVWMKKQPSSKIKSYQLAAHTYCSDPVEVAIP